MKLNRYLLYLLLAVLACPVTSFAIDEVTNLDQVVVTASRIEELKADQTMNITVLSEEQIKESSAKDLRDLLSTQGFKVREYPNSLSAVQIRGFCDRHSWSGRFKLRDYSDKWPPHQYVQSGYDSDGQR